MITPEPAIAFLHLGQTHDEFPEVASALSRRGVQSRLVHLADADAADWTCYAATNVRECRGYHLDPNFLGTLERISTRIAPGDFTNSMAVVRGTLDKSVYLPLLERAGVRLVPTCWPRSSGGLDLEEVFEETGWNEWVMKPTVSSKSWKTCRVSRSGRGVSLWFAGTPAPRHYDSLAESAQFLSGELRQRAYCAQRYMPEIETHGEISLVFLGGRFSHAMRKTAAPGGWLAHEFYGGVNTPCTASRCDVYWAEGIQELLENQYGRLHYARIDAIPADGQLALLECELIVPRLFLREGCAVERYADVLCADLGRR